MTLNIHDTTPVSRSPKWLQWLVALPYVLLWGIFLLAAYAVIRYSGKLLIGICLGLFPLLFCAWMWWIARCLGRAHVDIGPASITVTEYPFGIRRGSRVLRREIHHTELVHPSSMKLRGPRIPSIGVPYIVFYDGQNKQLFKLLACPKAVEFQENLQREGVLCIN